MNLAVFHEEFGRETRKPSDIPGDARRPSVARKNLREAVVPRSARLSAALLYASHALTLLRMIIRAQHCIDTLHYYRLY